MAGDPVADDYLALLIAGLPSKFSSKRRSGRDAGRSAKFPALNRFDQPIQAAPQNLRMQHMTAPSGYDLTAGRLPLPIPGTGAGTVTGTGAGTGTGTGASTGTVIASGTATGTSGTQFSAEENLLAIRNQAKQNPDTQAGYRRLFGVLQSFCAAHDHEAQIFSLDLAELFCAYMLSRITRNGGPPISVSNYFSAFNFVFQHDLKKGRPWSGTEISDLTARYAAASKQRSNDMGVEVPSMRIPTPAIGIVHIFKLLETAQGEFLCWLATFTIMLLFWFRADTLGGVRKGDPARPDDPGDIYFSSHGYLCFTVRRVKRGSAHIQAFVKSISPPPPANTLRTMIWAKLRLALDVKKNGTRLIGPQLWGDDPKRAADVISQKMKEILHRGDCGIPLGTFISSHSWRKAGASAAACLRIDWHTIMCWGMWKTHISAEKYIDPTYLFDRVLASIFDFLMNVHTPQLEFLEGTGWKGYDGHDMADDGVFEMGKLDLN